MRTEKDSGKILVIDDELGMRDLLNMELSGDGYSVSVAANGMEGIEILKKEKFDLAVCDIMMPGLSGLETLEAIKTVDPEVEVIMVTGHATIENALAAIKKGAYDFIRKPFDLNEIKGLIQKALEKSELKALIGVYEASKAVFNSFQKKILLPRIVGLASKVLKADDVSIFLVGKDGELETGTSTIPIEQPEGKSRLELARKQLKERDPMGKESKLLTNSQIVHPLIINGETLGFLMVNRTDNTIPFNNSDLRNATIFSSQVAQAVYNAKIYHDLEDKVQELKISNQQLKEAQLQLVQSEKLAAVGQLAAGVAHELNNPLTGILGLSQMILEDPVPSEEQRVDLETIVNESKRCRLIIKNLLKFSRKNEPKREPVDIIALLDSTIKMVHYDFTNSSIKVHKEYSLPLPPVFGDPAQLQQVFINIITNARHAMVGERAGQLTVQAHQKSNRIYLQFKDNGGGISEENLSKIFDPFFTTKPTGQGTGLGLSLSYGIIKEHGGSIAVESQLGVGTAFTIELPAHHTVPPVMKEPTASNGKPPSAGSDTHG